MVGKTKLIRATGSPLIGGQTSKRRRVWPWIVAAVIALAACGAVIYLIIAR